MLGAQGAVDGGIVEEEYYKSVHDLLLVAKKRVTFEAAATQQRSAYRGSS